MAIFYFVFIFFIFILFIDGHNYDRQIGQANLPLIFTVVINVVAIKTKSLDKGYHQQKKGAFFLHFLKLPLIMF